MDSGAATLVMTMSVSPPGAVVIVLAFPTLAERYTADVAEQRHGQHCTYRLWAARQ
ncbi:hypothetical protein [Streptomyces sp. NPDC090025]|uniref:hypothetical protein n=1 Tax=Streptomyces sp. NPDC090025 TaxID=3365922 RepID=UPI0038395200